MPQLAEIQRTIARSMVTGRAEFGFVYLLGGHDPKARLAIHLRHYASSLVSALHEKFPATNWLIGGEAFSAAAAAFVREHPPREPCIAEYADKFPAFIGRIEGLHALPYVEPFARLEWALGRVSIAVERTPLTWPDVAKVGSEALLNARLSLQPGLRYIRADYGVDALMRLYLKDETPHSFAMPFGDTPIEARGARGTLQFRRLDAGTFAFRSALHGGEPFADAAERGLSVDSNFDAGKALGVLVGDGLVASIDLSRGDGQ